MICAAINGLDTVLWGLKCEPRQQQPLIIAQCTRLIKVFLDDCMENIASKFLLPCALFLPLQVSVQVKKATIY